MMDNTTDRGGTAGSGGPRPGGTDPSMQPTSARTRDAAKLRSVMDRAAERTAAPRPTTLRTPKVAAKPIRALMSDPSRGAYAPGEDDPAPRPRTSAPRATTPQLEQPAAAASAAARIHRAVPEAEPQRAPADAAQPTNGQKVSTAQRAAIAPPTLSGGTSGGAFYTSPRKRRRPVLATIAVLSGITVGIGLYAGGADIISSIFSRRTEQPHPDPNPAAVTERPLPPPAPVQAADDSVGIDAVDRENNVADAHAAAPAERRASEVLADAPTTTAARPREAVEPARPAAHVQPREALREPARTTPRQVPATAAHATPARPAQTTPPTAPSASRRVESPAPSEDAPAPSSAASATSAGRPTGDQAPSGATRPAPAATPRPPAAHPSTPTTAAQGAGRSTGGKFMVQVRATSDEAEANTVARRLKSKGASGVAIVQTKKADGTTLYRVRYSGTGSSGDAQAAAARAGYKNVWVVQQKAPQAARPK